MLPLEIDHLRVTLHILAATVWVGGQLTLGALVPTVRTFGPDAARTVARRYNQVAWPAFGLLVLTGVWNLLEEDVADRSTAYQVTVMVKLLVVAASGVGAFLHTISTTKVGLAVWGAVGLLGALAAVVLGVQLRG